MELKGNFYNINGIERAEDGNYTVNVVLSPEHQIYAGHFPGKPVVPGVCTLTIIKEIVGEVLGRDVRFDTIKECKYISALVPEKNLGIIVNVALADGEKLRASVVKETGLQPVLKLRATIK